MCGRGGWAICPPSINNIRALRAGTSPPKKEKGKERDLPMAFHDYNESTDGEKEKRSTVSRVLFRRMAASIINLLPASPLASINLPPVNGRAGPEQTVYLVFQPIRFTTASLSPTKVVSSCLAFSPLPPVRRRYLFCGTRCGAGLWPLRPFPLGSMVARVARTFLSQPPEGAASDRALTAFRGAKVHFFRHVEKKLYLCTVKQRLPRHGHRPVWRAHHIV